MSLFVADDATSRNFEPFALTRPASELRAGAELLRRRWEIAFGETTTGLLASPELVDFEEGQAPEVHRGVVPAGSIVASARCAVSLTAAPRDAAVWRCAGRVAAVRIAAALPAETFDGLTSLDALEAASDKVVDVRGWWLDDMWDFVKHLGPMLAEDIPLIAGTLAVDPGPPGTVMGEHPVHIERGATIDPLVVFDAGDGPILVRRGSHVMPFSRLVGPCTVGEGTVVHGGRISGSAVGDSCRVHGEVSATIFVGHANKAHDGFLGHSMVGRWVNLGAATVNSNLKNTYGSVSLWTPTGLKDTGMTFLGAFLGDHVKTAIGTRLTTGCVLGAGANVFGDGTLPKYVPPFAWGVDSGQRFALDRFLLTAQRVMERRQVSLGERGRQHLTRAWERARDHA